VKIGVQLPEVEREVRWPELREMALLAEGIGHVQLVLDPITPDSIRALAPTVAALRENG
jgi:hypothetical protein